ncbi:Os03g0658532 [Oryza sativa Japonica Group]|uniref:Os03g0658532 protein n=1 Tax=Oryza sativa subsp. japonica TaxID=39947 RepID=A0A0P0W101_ORYSJ|nr:Os03g0658532 [Oryza sativa Japonica Group]
MVVSQGACRSPFFSSPAAPTSPSVPAHHCLPPAAPAHTAAHFLPLHRPVRERVKREKEAEDGADEGEADVGFPRRGFRTSLWPAAASMWSVSEPAGVAPFARRSSAMRLSPEAAAISSGARPRLGLSASAPYSRSTSDEAANSHHFV